MKVVVAGLLLMAVCIAGCGGETSTSACFVTSVIVFPQPATADHTATAPGNSVRFVVFQSGAPPGCAFATVALQDALWSVSDTVNVSISNSHDNSNLDYGRATCINATPSPVTVTATVPSGNGNTSVINTAALTCN